MYTSSYAVTLTSRYTFDIIIKDLRPLDKGTPMKIWKKWKEYVEIIYYSVRTTWLNQCNNGIKSNVVRRRANVVSESKGQQVFTFCLLVYFQQWGLRFQMFPSPNSFHQTVCAASPSLKHLTNNYGGEKEMNFVLSLSGQVGGCGGGGGGQWSVTLLCFNYKLKHTQCFTGQWLCTGHKSQSASTKHAQLWVRDVTLRSTLH